MNETQLSTDEGTVADADLQVGVVGYDDGDTPPRNGYSLWLAARAQHDN